MIFDDAMNNSCMAFTAGRDIDFPENLVDQKKLTTDQKLRIAEDIIAQRSTAQEMSKRFGLKRKYLNKLVWKVKHNKVVSSFKGRPTMLDAESVGNLKTISISSDTIDNTTLLQEIVKESENTWSRRHPEQDIPIKISKRSIYRYAAKLNLNSKYESTTEQV